MYSPPAITTGTKYERSSSSHPQQDNYSIHPVPLNPIPQQKLPSLPPFPSLVSSLGERSQEYTQHFNGSNSSSSAIPPLPSHTSALLPPPPFYSQQHHYPSSHSPSSVESATRSSFEQTTSLYPQQQQQQQQQQPTHRSDIGRNHTSTPSISEDRKPELPLPAGYPTALPFRLSSTTHLPSMSGNGTGTGVTGAGAGVGPGGQSLEWESSIRTGSTSASTLETPRSPAHPNVAKRRRISAAHDAVHGSASADDLHDDDDHHHLGHGHGHGQIDELSPNLAHLNNSTLMGESASPPGGGESTNNGDDTMNEDEKGANGRTLKQTKRAAQNRAAQQAFRKRKEERIRELEEKEKVLNSLVARENEIMRRERILAERERAAAVPYNNGTTSSGQAQDGRTAAAAGGAGAGPAAAGAPSASATATNDWDRAFASAPVASPVQHIAERLESSNRTNDILKNEVENLKKQLMDKNALVESLRRSLEDLGGENRNLRDALGRSSGAPSSLEGRSQQQQQQQQQHNQNQQRQQSQPQHQQQQQQQSRAAS